MGKFDMRDTAFKIVEFFKIWRSINYLYIPYTTRQLIEKRNDKVDQII